MFFREPRLHREAHILKIKDLVIFLARIVTDYQGECVPIVHSVGVVATDIRKIYRSAVRAAA